MTFTMGIDGGGTKLRVVVVDETLQVCAEANGETVNPSVVGHEVAAQRVQQAIHEALNSINLTPSQIAAVGVGIAGASVEHSEAWLRETIAPVLSDSRLALSSDVEIALVGAHGQREGILLLSGTGSCAYGINAQGERLLVGGWGYLIGDEGSGYWMGRKALRQVAIITDEKRRDDPSREFKAQVLDFLEIRTPRQMVKWIYGQGEAVPRVATLAPLMIVMAQEGNPHAKQIVTLGALRLVDHALQVCDQLNMTGPIAFAGGLLEKSFYYRQLVAESLGIDVPMTKYAPVVGAALLAVISH